MPALCLMDELPLKTSGKVDRKALPWPLPNSNLEMTSRGSWTRISRASRAVGRPTRTLPFTADSDFFALGVAPWVWWLRSALRQTHPDTEIARIYADPTLRGMAAWTPWKRRPTRSGEPGTHAGVDGGNTGAFLVGLCILNGLRYVMGSLIVVWVLSVVVDAAWVLTPILAPVHRLARDVLFIRAGAFRAAAGAGSECGPAMGHYPRWVDSLTGFGPQDALVVFNKVRTAAGHSDGAHAAPALRQHGGAPRASLNALPPVTGLVTIGENASLEQETDIAGYWLDGDTLHVGAIEIGAHARPRTRTLVDPGSRVGQWAGSRFPRERDRSGRRTVGRLAPRASWSRRETWPEVF